MKSILLSAILLFSILISKAQVIPEDIVTRINNSQYIFEGKVLRSNAYYTQDHRMIYTSSTIDIYKIFKGNLTCGTVEVITKGGCVGDVCLDISHSLTLKRGMLGIFLCNESTLEQSLIDYYPETNPIKLDFPYDIQGYIKYFEDDFNQEVVDYQYSLDSLAQVYNLIDLYTQLNFIDCHGSSALAERETRAQARLAHKQSDDSIQQYINALNISGSSNTINTADTNLTISLINPQLTGTNPKYFEFDIAFNDNVSGVYFANHFPKIIYDTLTFVPNIKAAGKVWVNNSTLIADTTSYKPTIVQDYARNTLNVYIINKNSGINLVDIPSSPTPVVHLKLEINNCGHSGYLLQSLGTQPYYYPHYSMNPNLASPLHQYDSIINSSYLYFSGCGSVQIFSIVPTVVSAGTNDTVTVSGSHFGQTKGKVFLKEADQGGAYYLNLDSSDYTSWNDSIIQFVMPGIVDSAQQVLNQAFGTPGTGPLKVQTASGDSAEGFIKVRFALTSSIVNSQKYPNTPFDFSAFNRGGVKFLFDTSFTNYPQRMNIFLKAMHEWVCLANMHFEAGDTIIADTISALTFDTISIVKFDTLAIGTLAQTYLYSKSIGNCGRYYWRPSIIFNSLYSSAFWCDTSNCDTVPIGKRDMYAVALHELGHAHGVNHQNDQTKILYYASFFSNTSVILPQNRQIYLDDDTPADSAAHKVINRALDPNIASCVISNFGGQPITPIHLSDCAHIHRIMSCSWIGINELGKFGEIEVYPNPANSEISINLGELADEEISIKIMDITGKEIDESSKRIMKGESSLNIDISNFNLGVYLIKFESKTATGGSMFIKN